MGPNTAAGPRSLYLLNPTTKGGSDAHRIHLHPPQRRAVVPRLALDCARAFGALITMRDAPSDAVIPDEFPPDTKWDEERIATAEKRIAEMNAMTPAQLDQAAQSDHDEAMRGWTERAGERAAAVARYEAMREQVEAWTPPTPEHTGMKEFMLQQLTESIRFDGPNEWDHKPQALNGQAWADQQIAQAQRTIELARKGIAEEIERAAQRTAWVQALRASLIADD